jgi:hypothetical protein
MAAEIPKGMAWKLIRLSWRSVVGNKWAFLGVVLVNLIVAVRSFWIVAPDQTVPMDWSYALKETMWNIDVFTTPFWTYVVLFGLKSEGAVHIVKRCLAGAGYYVVFMLGCVVVFAPAGGIWWGIHSVRTGVMPIGIIFAALTLLGGIYAAIRLQFFIPSKIAQDRMTLRQTWNLSKGWILSPLLAIIVISLPGILVSVGIEVMGDKLLPAAYAAMVSASAGGVLGALSTGINVHAYRGARAYAAQRESSIVPSESA